MLLISNVGLCETSRETKEKVDNLKLSIQYPKYNIGDILYIAFLKNDNVGTNNFRDSDIIVKKVKIADMMLYNSIGGPEFQIGLYMEANLQEFPIKWKYQFVDTSIANPKYGDLSNFIDESSFCESPEEAKNALKQALRNQ